MAKTQDFTAAMKDIMGKFPVDTAAFEGMFKNNNFEDMFKNNNFDGMFKNTNALTEKLSGVALSAAEKSAEVSSKWTKETIAKLGDMANAKTDPADFAKVATDLASAAAEVAAENMAAFAEIAKKVQADTVELMMAAGKDATEDASTAVKKATSDVTAAATKAAAK